MGNRLVAVSIALVITMALAPSAQSAARSGGASADSPGVLEIPVSFDVINKNDSSLPCLSDDQPYTVRGHLVGPRRQLIGPDEQPRVITILLTGMDEGEWTWRFRAVPGYDYPYEMAKLGHVSLSLDMLGYGSSDRPPGDQLCWGSQADVNHQITQDLRNGAYTVPNNYRAVPFTTVLVSAHDTAPLAALNQAYTWGDIDGLSTQVIAHQGAEPYIYGIIAENTAECALGGEGADDPKDDPTPGGQYVYFGPPDEEFRHDLFLEDENGTAGGTDPAVIDAVIGLRNRNPCGHITSIPSAYRMDLVNMRGITIPVLLVFPGPDDPIFSRSGEESEAANYASTDVTTAWMDTGHFMTLERCAPAFRQLTAAWIHERWGAGQGVAGPPVGPDQCVTEVRVKGP